METSKLLAILLASSLTFAAGGVAAKGSEKAQKPEKPGLTNAPSMILAREASEGPRGGACGGRAQPPLGHLAHHLDSTHYSQSGILMHVHSAGLLKDAGWVAPPSLSDPVRMNRNNLLGHHT